MKKMIMAVLLMGLIILAGCGMPAEEKLKKEKQLDSLVAEAQAVCSPEEDEYNNSLCLAEEASQLDDEYNTFLDETKAYYPNIAHTLCDSAVNPDVCYFYSAFLLKDQQYCNEVEDKEGCRMITNGRYCYVMDNQDECLAGQAFFLSFVDKSKALEICQSLPEKYWQPADDLLTCADVNFEAEEYDSEPLREKFLVMYLLSSIADLHVEYV